MLNMKIENAIINIVESMLPRFTHPNYGLVISLDLSDSENHNASTRSTIQFIFHRPDNYTKVLVNYSFNNGLITLFKNSEYYFEKYSDHDSCWRSDGLKVLSEHWHNVHKHFNKHPSDLSSYYTFNIFQRIKYLKFKKFEAVKEKNGFIRGYNIIIDEFFDIYNLPKEAFKDVQ